MCCRSVAAYPGFELLSHRLVPLQLALRMGPCQVLVRANPRRPFFLGLEPLWAKVSGGVWVGGVRSIKVLYHTMLMWLLPDPPQHTDSTGYYMRFLFSSTRPRVGGTGYHLLPGPLGHVDSPLRFCAWSSRTIFWNLSDGAGGNFFS